jgi:hypothetical protein
LVKDRRVNVIPPGLKPENFSNRRGKLPSSLPKRF